jgi:hypothetical protein
MRRRRKRTNLLGVLIFVAIVALTGVGLVATDNVSNPFDFIGELSLIQRVNERYNQLGQEAGDRNGHMPRPDLPQGDENDIVWPAVMAVVYDTWVLCAVIACYMLIQQALGWVLYRLRSTKAPEPAVS